MERVSKYCSQLMLSIFGIILMLITSSIVFAESIDNIQLLKISPQDERAVIKTAKGMMAIIKMGDTIGENEKVVEITTGRLVIEEQTERGREVEGLCMVVFPSRKGRIKFPYQKAPPFGAMTTGLSPGIFCKGGLCS